MVRCGCASRGSCPPRAPASSLPRNCCGSSARARVHRQCRACRMARMFVRVAQLPRALLLAVAAAALLGPALPAAAEEPPAAAPPAADVYNIEIVVFRATSALGGPENWSAEAGARNIAGEESASGAATVGHFVAALPSSAWQLGELESRLRTSGVYVPVAHTAWSQTASSWGTRAGFSVQKLGIEVPGLSGTVFLE